MVAARLLRQARRRAGWSQRQLAARARWRQPSIATIESGVHDPRVGRLDALLGSLGCRLVVVPSRSLSAADAAEEIFDLLRTGDEPRAFRQLLQLSDDLRSEEGGVKVALTVASPAPTGDVRYDAFIAGLVEYVLGAEGLPVPAWVEEPERCSLVPWVVDPYGDDDVEGATPTPFSRRGVFLSPSELESV